ncbi:MAG: methyltransferase domain-containing protein [Methylococcales bacterium]|nr:methyltransferase domain-containing protein [Methylococcales bacterium]
MNTTAILPDDAMFSTVIVQDYEMLKMICPLAVEMSRLVGVTVGAYPDKSEPLSVVELGGGTGITTLSLLMAKDSAQIISVDIEPAMQAQAQQNLQAWMDNNRLSFYADDALSALKNIASDSVDIVASAYTIHNFLTDYREQVIKEIFRVLKPAGQFINGDRYALDDISEHTRLTQQEIAQFFKVLIAADKLDLLEQWMVHLFSDESENRVMRESLALTQLRTAGFTDIKLAHRQTVNALVTATKPAQEQQYV